MRRRAVDRLCGAVAVAAALPACVAIHAPLLREPGYPADWPEPAGLGPECQTLAATYANDGVVAGPDGVMRPARLSAVLNIPTAATRLALEVHTRKVDRHGDTFATLKVVTDDDTASRHDVDGCFCVRQTLACTQLTESYWTIPNLGVGGRQTNVYLSVATDGSLIARLQDYRLDVIVAVPIMQKKEPWLRFTRLAVP